MKHKSSADTVPAPAPPQVVGDGAAARLLSKPEVLDRVALTFPTVWKLMREKKFPQSRALGGKTVWLESDIEAWIKALPVRKYKDTDSVAA